ncbi:hypothetical protein BDB01DRAFT_848156 [Pilobolus umbonatus]|nr:hypothetical protein BDB01DRAFT_848156 [Pilobolus umbonatus]
MSHKTKSRTNINNDKTPTTESDKAIKILNEQIQEVKEELRTAYSLSAKVEGGYEPTEKEKKLIADQPVQSKLLQKLEGMMVAMGGDINTGAPEKKPYKRRKAYSFTLLHFFYLVRVAQQGFFHLNMSAYPAIEPRAVTYLCDKLVGASIYASQSVGEEEKKHRLTVLTILDKLHHGVDEPIAEGFKTTYKQVKAATRGLVNQNLKQQQQQYQQQQASTSSQNPLIPPIWVVMPYSTMIDNNSFAMPGALPISPFPGVFPSTTMPQTVLSESVSQDDTRTLSDDSEDSEDEMEPRQPLKIETNTNTGIQDEIDERFADPEMSEVEDEINEESTSITADKEAKEEQTAIVDNKTNVVDKKTNVVDKKTNVVDKKTNVVDKKTNVVDNKTNVVDNKTNLVDNKTNVVEEKISPVPKPSTINEDKRVEEKKEMIGKQIIDVLTRDENKPEPIPTVETEVEGTKISKQSYNDMYKKEDSWASVEVEYDSFIKEDPFIKDNKQWENAVEAESPTANPSWANYASHSPPTDSAPASPETAKTPINTRAYTSRRRGGYKRPYGNFSSRRE